MLLLALETSTDPASCALWCDGEVIETVCAGARPSSETLLPAVGALLADAGLTLGELDAVAFGAGPGSFTGLRIACGVAQGIAFGLDVPVVPVNTLAAIAEACGETQVMAVLDARMQEVYFGCFRRHGDDRLEAVGEIGVAAPEAVPAPAAGWTIAGNALTAYPRLAERLAGHRQHPQILPTAAAVAVLGARQFAAGGAIAPDAAAPLYVRDKVALTVAERLAAGGKA